MPKVINNTKDKDRGFTIIELLIATTFFSMLLLFVVASFVQINRRSQESFKAKLVQDAARVIMNDIANTIRGYSGQLEIYDEPTAIYNTPGVTHNSGFVQTYTYDSSPVATTDANGDPVPPKFHNGSVLRICAGSKRLGWNEHNVGGGNGTNGWLGDSHTREHTWYEANGFTDEITLIKSDDLAAAANNVACDSPIDFAFDGVVSSALSTELRIHDLDVTEIASNGNSYTYKIELVVATIDNNLDTPYSDTPYDGIINDWETGDIVDYTSTSINPGTNKTNAEESDFAQKGILVPGSSRLTEPICKTGDGAEFCKVIKMEMIASTRP